MVWAPNPKSRRYVVVVLELLALNIIATVWVLTRLIDSVPFASGPGIVFAQSPASQKLDEGIKAYKNGSYDEAIALFKQAKALDPKLFNARLYLATAYAMKYIPGAPSEENVRAGFAAVEEFRGVLELESGNLSAIDGIASALFQMAGDPFNVKMFEESRDFHKKHIELKPDDPEPYYWVGVINWTIAYRANKKLREQLNQQSLNSVQDNDPIPSPARRDFDVAYSSIVEEGIRCLRKAIELDPEYENAMAYLNLLYRQKADYAEFPSERTELLRKADELVERVKETRMKKSK